MLRRPWKQVLKRTAGAFVLCAVPALALTCFSPGAFTALASASVTPRQPAALVAAPTAVATADAARLDDFVATASKSTSTSSTSANAQIDLFLIKQAKALSASFGTQIKTMQASLNTLTPGTNGFNLLAQQLLLITDEANAFNASYKKTFIKGSSSNLNNLQNSLINLQTQFLNANTGLSIQQSTSIAKTGSVSAFTPPSFTF